MDTPKEFEEKFLNCKFQKNEFTDKYLMITRENLKEYYRLYQEYKKSDFITVQYTRFDYIFKNNSNISRQIKELLEKQKKEYSHVIKWLN
jgi:hypothetical protein